MSEEADRDSVRVLVERALTETEHVIQFTNDGWTIAHPLVERLDLDTLFDCGMRWDFGDIGIRGRYWLSWNDDGEPFVGAQINGGRDA
jgi:hypothetical protein